MEPSPTSPPPGEAPVPPPRPEPKPPPHQTPPPQLRPRPGPTRLGPIPLDRRTGLIAAAAVLLLLVFAWAGTGYAYEPFAEEPPALSGDVPKDERALKQAMTRLRTKSKQLRSRLKAAGPRGVYIVIDQTHNRLYLKKDEEVLLEAPCSAGSGMVLKESTGKKREWVFDTPRGRFEVLSMTRSPIWRKPDWAFIEEGQPIPKNPGDRLEYGTLGEYALYLGDGYMIHGTLYERLLGRAVSHGCIRVGRDDLRKVWANARIGMSVYIF